MLNPETTPSIINLSLSLNSVLFTEFITSTQSVSSGIYILSSGSCFVTKSAAEVDDTSSPS